MTADRRAQRGQASVELVAVVPFVLLIGAVVWQLTLAGHTAWLTANAAARSALPRSLEGGLEVRRLREGGVRVSVPVPLLVRRWRGPVFVHATSSLGRER
jgi:hypothetical protein